MFITYCFLLEEYIIYIGQDIWILYPSTQPF